jgi:cell division protein FtsN
MARGNGNRGGGDRILESRHLVGFFLGVVLLCGVFFTLGYTIGRNDYSATPAVHAAESPAMPATRPAPQPPSSPKSAAKSADTPNASAPAANEWDFYTKKDQNHLDPAPKPGLPAASAPSGDSAAGDEKSFSAPSRVPVHYQPPKMVKNSIVLQVTATRSQSDAMALADELQKKRFPSFVVTPKADAFYRVQVGPYSSEAEADAAKRALDREGFKPIIKR